MKPIVRLRDGDATDAERWLLDSASDDVPPPDARAHTLAMLGLAAGAVPVVSGALTATVKAASSSGAVGSASAASAAKTASSVVGISVLKWLGTGAIVGALAAGSVAVVTTPGLLTNAERPGVSNPGTHAPVLAKGSIEPVAGAVATEPRADAPLRPVDDIPSATNPVPRATSDKGSAVAIPEPTTPAIASSRPAENANDVAAQVAALDRARAALAAGDPRSALGALVENERAFPGGALEPEAVVLRVRAWLDLGQRQRATAIAEQFLVEHPGTPQGARLRALIGSGSASP